ncbi:hypothetical protein Tco_1439030 [Tanacetum coccineum]
MAEVRRGVKGEIERVISIEGYACIGIGFEGGKDYGFDSNEEEVVPKIDEVSLVDEVLKGAFGGDGDDDLVMGDGVEVSSSSFVKSINSCLGGIMVSLNFLEGLEEDAWVEAMEVEK